MSMNDSKGINAKLLEEQDDEVDIVKEEPLLKHGLGVYSLFNQMSANMVVLFIMSAIALAQTLTFNPNFVSNSKNPLVESESPMATIGSFTKPYQICILTSLKTLKNDLQCQSDMEMSSLGDVGFNYNTHLNAFKTQSECSEGFIDKFIPSDLTGS